uniref:Uncharacterized protein n=1 Tax=Cacopsylla melanoneura TaxID=428564 RepID=A0A8D9ARB4_9HEMI
MSGKNDQKKYQKGLLKHCRQVFYPPPPNNEIIYEGKPRGKGLKLTIQDFKKISNLLSPHEKKKKTVLCFTLFWTTNGVSHRTCIKCCDIGNLLKCHLYVTSCHCPRIDVIGLVT